MEKCGEKGMDKDEILKRGREDGPDEREQKILCDAYSFAGTVGCVICILFIVFSLLANKNPFPYCLIAMAYCSSEKFYKYAKLKKKNDLIYAIIAGIAALCWMILSILKF